MAKRQNCCLYPGDSCRNKAIKGHSVQNCRVLETLSTNGLVIMPEIKSSISNPFNTEFRLVGRNLATTFTGLCSEHDNALFQPIETGEIDVDNDEHLFLLAYRAVLKEANETRSSAINIQATYVRGANEGLYSKTEPSPIGQLAVEQVMSACMIEHLRQEFGSAYLRAEWSRISHKAFDLHVAPSIAVNSVFSSGFYSDTSDSLAFVALNVFPNNKSTSVIFSFLSEHLPEASSAFDRIWSATGTYQQYEMSKLILRKCENFVMSPTLYDSFPIDQKHAVIEYFERNTCGHTYDIDDPRLFLFTRIEV